MTARRRIERLEAHVNAPPADTFREHWWRGVALASQDTEPGPAPEGGRLVLSGGAAAAVLCWWEASGQPPTDPGPLAVLRFEEVACPCP